MRHHIIALRSAIKAGLKQYRRRLTELRRDEAAAQAAYDNNPDRL